MGDLVNFNRRLESGFRRKDGLLLKELLRLQSLSATKAMEEYVSKGGALPTVDNPNWSKLPDIVDRRFKAGAALNWGDWVACYEHLAECLLIFLRAMQADDAAWCIPPMYALSDDVRICAEQADVQLDSEGKNQVKMLHAENVLKRAFAMTNIDRRARPLKESKRYGTLGAINLLLKIYFKINQLGLCPSITRVVDAPDFPPFEQYPPQDRVTFKYYSGRLHLFGDRVKEAAEDLQYAFDCLPESAETHKRRVLLYLIPAKLLMGKLPSKGALVKYKMHWFYGIVNALRTGNLGDFHTAVEKHEEFFIRKALYLSVEQMRPLVYRSLCRIMMETKKRLAPGENGYHKVSLQLYRRALTLCGIDLEIGQVECTLANLIFRNYVKGYISHQVGFLVLARKNAFPPLI